MLPPESKRKFILTRYIKRHKGTDSQMCHLHTIVQTAAKRGAMSLQCAQSYMAEACLRFVYVMAWARVQLRINFTSIFKVFTKIWKTLKIQVKLILNCTRALAITCLSHVGQNYVQRTTCKFLPSRKHVCRLSLKNRL